LTLTAVASDSRLMRSIGTAVWSLTGSCPSRNQRSPGLARRNRLATGVNKVPVLTLLLPKPASGLPTGSGALGSKTKIFDCIRRKKARRWP
jgi:hypothetical protein